MQILFLNHNVIWSGTFLRCFQFAKGLVKHGHKVAIITNHPTAKFQFSVINQDGVEIIQSPDFFTGQLRTGWDPINAIRRILYLRNRRFDILHAFDCRPTVILPALCLKRRLKIPLVIDWADWWGRGGAVNLRHPLWLNKLFEPIETFFEEFFRRFADASTVISPLLFDRAKKLVGSNKKIFLLPNGSDTDNFRPINKRLARRRLNLSNKKYIAVFSGYVIYDIGLVIEAIRTLVKQGFPIYLIVTGSTAKILYRLGTDLIDAGKLIITGKVDFKLLSYYLSSADIALMPLSDHLANRARVPMKFGDYLAAGIPILTNPVGFTAELVKTKKLGTVCDFQSAVFARAIKTLCSNRILRKSLSGNCLNFARTDYHYMERVKLLEKIYSRLIFSK